jgi:asparagine synthase (glutamine-hydrolysing)
VCGIYGIAAQRAERLPDHTAALRAMRDALRHRGPDGDGLCRGARAALGATRLRVVDLDPRADQPFSDPAGVILASNGEIYNAPELRRRYPRYPFRSRSDAETLLPLYLDRGPAGLADAVGMFAVAIWDDRTGRLTLARDRAGEKPMFWAEHQGAIWFASEIGALLRAGVPTRPLDRTALIEYLRLGYVREPRTLHAGIHKVPAGTIMTFGPEGNTQLRYWDPTPSDAPVVPVAPVVLALIESAITAQLASDVPLGVFTSGGLDSSLLATLAARAMGPAKVHSFAVGFADRAYDERPWARRLARQLGTPHHEVEVSDADVPEALDALAGTGEPIGDPAAIPTLLLSRAARRHVTVVLSGEGADELFGGYPTYLGHRYADHFAALPGPVRRALTALVHALPPSRGPVPMGFLLDRFLDAAALPWRERHEAWFGTGLAASGLLGPAGARPEAAARPAIVGDDVAGAASCGSWPSRGFRPRMEDVVGTAMRVDYETALRERLLVKVDRATMLASLEARAPFLDPAVTQAALGAPGRAHVGPFGTKRLLREVARGTVPRFILRRRKRGLSVPLARWLQGPMATALADCRDLPRLTGGLVPAEGLDPLLADPGAVIRHARALWPLVALRGWLRVWNLEEAE